MSECKLDKALLTDIRRCRNHCDTLDCEPGRIPVKRINRLLNKSRKTRRIIHKHIAEEFPKSSRIHEWTRNIKKGDDL